MKKFNWKKLLFVLLVLVIVAYTIGNIFFPEQTQNIVATVWGWLNQPLPIVGVSFVVIGAFLVKVLQMTGFGKEQIKEVKSIIEKAQEEADEKAQKITDDVGDMVQELEELKEEVEFYKEKLAQVCGSIRNVKVNEIGKELGYGKEESND